MMHVLLGRNGTNSDEVSFLTWCYWLCVCLCVSSRFTRERMKVDLHKLADSCLVPPPCRIARLKSLDKSPIWKHLLNSLAYYIVSSSNNYNRICDCWVQTVISWWSKNINHLPESEDWHIAGYFRHSNPKCRLLCPRLFNNPKSPTEWKTKAN